MLRPLSAGNGKLLDPINQSGTGSGNGSFLPVHTQSADNPAIGQRGYSVQSYCRCGRLSA